jgi:C4-dicarboxylate-binding protein DctP
MSGNSTIPNLSANSSKQIPFSDTFNQMIKKIVNLVIAILLTLLALNTPALAVDKQIVIKFSHVAAMDTPKSKSIEHFKQLVERKTAGKVRVDVYPNSTLYKDKEELEALQMGAVQMLAPTLSKFGPLGIREFEVFDLPFLFDDRAALRRVVEGPIGQRLFNILETKGIRGLAYWDNGFKMMSANRPIRVPADMRGLKVRIQGSKVIDEQMRTLGANPQVISFSEMTQALQSGVVDGAENPPLNFYSQKVYEVQKHLAVTEHGYLGFAVIVNKRFWDGLPPEIRSGLEAAIVEATQMNNALTERESAEAMQAISKTGKTAIYKPTSQELALWRQALLPVHKKMEDRIGKDLLASVYKALGKELER